MLRSGINQFKARRDNHSAVIIVKRRLQLNRGFRETGAGNPLKGGKGDNGWIVQGDESGKTAKNCIEE